MKRFVSLSLILLMLFVMSANVFAAEMSQPSLQAPVKIAATNSHDGMNMGSNPQQPSTNNSNADPHANMSASEHSQMNSNQHTESTGNSGPNWLVIGGFSGVIALIIIVAAILKRKSAGVNQ
ncbi:MAG: hypothetical protein GX434_14410 [Peptococcaceae bacterium]|nr:hypothetical protein [Peptococcaceae bacterium]